MSRPRNDTARIREAMAVREHEADIKADHPPAMRSERETAKVLEILDALDAERREV